MKFVGLVLFGIVIFFLIGSFFSFILKYVWKLSDFRFFVCVFGRVFEFLVISGSY